MVPGSRDALASEVVQIRKPSSSNSRLPPILNIPPAEDPLLHFLTSLIQNHGNRAKASRITARMLLRIYAFTRAPPLPIVRQAVAAASPAVKCLNHRHGAKNVHKPVALGEKQRTRLALQWIIQASDGKAGQTLDERLAREIIAVMQGNSKALKAKDDAHRFAMVNRGNSQFRR